MCYSQATSVVESSRAFRTIIRYQCTSSYAVADTILLFAGSARVLRADISINIIGEEPTYVVVDRIGSGNTRSNRSRELWLMEGLLCLC
jgi:hypothetical protein